ncbi:MAG: MlaD family protein [Patulibacter minatonensis]
MSAVGGRKSSMSPALIGSITVLIIVITTFLAYNANQGLPWVPSKALTVEVKDAANIVPGNEVRIGGTRVGIVAKARAKQYPDGRATALLDLKLDQTTAPLPEDTTVLIRARSLLGLKYVQLTMGKDKKTFPWGTTVPLKNATPDPVEIDQLLNTFDDPTRVGIIQAVTNFGDALAGRGTIIGKLIDDAGPLADSITPVAKVLADKDNGLVPFLTALTRFTTEFAAAGNSTGDLFRGLDRTTGALAAAGDSIDETLRIAPDALTSTANSLRVTRGAIGPHIQFARTLRPAFANIREGSGDIAAATDAGVNGLGGTPRFARDLTSVLNQLDNVSKSTVVARGLDGLTQFTASAAPLVTSLSQAQRVCHYPSLLLRGLASATSDGDSTGNWVRVVPYLPLFAENGETGTALSPLNGADGLPAGAYSNLGETRITRQQQVKNNAFLTTNPTPITGANGQCGPGYETRPDFTKVTSPLGVTVGGATGSGSKLFIPAPPKGSKFRNPKLDASSEDSGE